MDEVSLAREPNDSPGALFSASIIDFRDEAGKRLVLFLRIGFHGATINLQAIRRPWGVFLHAIAIPPRRQTQRKASHEFHPSSAVARYGGRAN